MYHEYAPIEYWQLQDAKARLSELIKLATTLGPQGISVRGHNEVVVIPIAEYERLSGNKMNFFTFMQNSPLKGIDLEIERDKSTSRDIDL